MAHQEAVLNALKEHLYLVLVPLTLGLMVAVPLGILSGKGQRWSKVLLNVFNTLRVIPSLAVLFLAIPLGGLTDKSAILALTLLVFPPLLLNADAGFRSLDPMLLEAAQGLGMTPWQRFWRIEFPLAWPTLKAGIKTATVEAIASATLAAFIGGGGFGAFIVLGFSLYDFSILLVGAIPVAVLAVSAEVLLERGLP
jgi:osmoprotectant transport system permease protein